MPKCEIFHRSGTDACAEHMGQGTDAFTEHTSQELMHALNAHMKFEKVPSKHADHMHQELMRMLSINLRNCA